MLPEPVANVSQTTKLGFETPHGPCGGPDADRSTPPWDRAPRTGPGAPRHLTAGPARSGATACCWRASPLSGAGRDGRRAHCAVLARYSSDPLRVAALRRSSLEIVEGERPS